MLYYLYLMLYSHLFRDPVDLRETEYVPSLYFQHVFFFFWLDLYVSIGMFSHLGVPL